MQQEKGEVSSSFSAEEEEEAGSRKQTAAAAQEDKFNESAKEPQDKPQTSFLERQSLSKEMRKNPRLSPNIAPCGAIPRFTIPSPAVKPDTIQERDQKSPTSDVKLNDPSPHIDHLYGSGNVSPCTREEPAGCAGMIEFPSGACSPAAASSPWPHVHTLTSAHASASSYMWDSLGPGKEELDKDKPKTIEEEFSDDGVDDMLPDAFSSPFSGLSRIRTGGSIFSRGCSGGQTKWTDLAHPPSSSAFLRPDKRIRLSSLVRGHTALQSKSSGAGFSYDSSSAEKECLLPSPSQQTQDEPRPAEHSLFADSDPQQTVDLLQGTGEDSSSSSSSQTMSPPTDDCLVLSDQSPPTPFTYGCGPYSNLSKGIVGPQDHSSDLQNFSTVPEGSRVQAELSSVQPEPESGGGVDAVVELEAAVTAVSCSLTNTLPTWTCSSGPSWTEGDSRSLPHSHSSPSLSHTTSAENKTLTRAQSSPDLHLNSSCEQFTPDITADEDDETYRFQCSGPGLYQCSVTDLVFHMEREGDVVYRMVPWNRKLLSQHHKQPAGPLFDIKCEQQSVCQLHLPHCEVCPSGGADFLSVAHVDKEVIEFIDPHKITETHVIINITGLSGFGIVKDEGSPPDQVQAMVLVFYRPQADPDPISYLNLLLLPRNVVLTAVLRFRKKLIEDECYLPVPPYCELYLKQEYTLSTCPQDDSVQMNPPNAVFDFSYCKNYLESFQVISEKPMSHLKLILTDTNSSLSVWERQVYLSSFFVQRSCEPNALKPKRRLFEIRSSFIKGVSGPVLKSLLDSLLEKTVMSDSERESAEERGDRGDRARFVMDTVRRKGEAACSEMIKALCHLDPFFSEHLGLT